MAQYPQILQWTTLNVLRCISAAAVSFQYEVMSARQSVHPPGCSEDMLNIQTKANNLWIDFFLQRHSNQNDTYQMRQRWGFIFSVCLSVCLCAELAQVLIFFFLYGLAGRQAVKWNPTNVRRLRYFHLFGSFEVGSSWWLTCSKVRVTQSWSN